MIWSICSYLVTIEQHLFNNAKKIVSISSKYQKNRNPPSHWLSLPQRSLKQICNNTSQSPQRNTPQKRHRKVCSLYGTTKHQNYSILALSSSILLRVYLCSMYFGFIFSDSKTLRFWSWSCPFTRDSKDKSRHFGSFQIVNATIKGLLWIFIDNRRDPIRSVWGSCFWFLICMIVYYLNT